MGRSTLEESLPFKLGMEDYGRVAAGSMPPLACEETTALTRQGSDSPRPSVVSAFGFLGGQIAALLSFRRKT